MNASAVVPQPPDSSLVVVPCDAALGANATGVDLRAPLAAGDVEALQRAVRDHLVVFFRSQPLDDEQHVDLACRLGAPLPHPITKLRGETSLVTVVRNDAVRRPTNAAWHSDLSWLEEPPGLAVLRATKIPERGGDTLWLDARAAWDDLDERIRARVRGRRATHDFDRAVGVRLRKVDGAAGHSRVRRAIPPATHPMVRVHPETGREALFVNEAFTSGIVDVEPEESERLLGDLFAHVAKCPHRVRHRWAEGDVVVWDERVTQHFAEADHYPAEREVRRVTLRGERPR